MLRYISLIFLIGLIGCEKEEELSKARILWGDWNVDETKIIYDDLEGIRLSTTKTLFQISFYHTNKGHIYGLSNEDFIWAIQDDPNVLIISPEPFSVDSLGEIHFNTSDLYNIREFSVSEVTLHNEFTSVIDSIISTTEIIWNLTPQ